MVVTYNHCPMGVAEDYLRSHVNQFIHKEEATLKHLLMEEHTAPGLGCNNDEHGYEVGSETRPWGIGKGHDCSVDKRLYRVMVLLGNDEIVALNIYPYSQSTE